MILSLHDLGELTLSADKYAEFKINKEKRENLSDVKYRKAVMEDSSYIAELTCRREGSETGRNLEYYLERTIDELKGIDETDDFSMFVAEHSKKIIGFGRIMYFNFDSSDNFHRNYSGWYLMGVIVDPDYRRMGIGRKLLEKRIDFVRDKADRIYYIVNARNKVSIHMHEKYGFERILECSEFAGIRFDGGKGFLCRKNLQN